MQIHGTQNKLCRFCSLITQTSVLVVPKVCLSKRVFYYRDSIMAFKCMNCLVPEYLSDQFTKRSSISTYKTRNSQLLNIPLFRSAAGQRTFYYRMVSIWNALPQNLKLSQSLAQFRNNLRKSLFNNELLLV